MQYYDYREMFKEYEKDIRNVKNVFYENNKALLIGTIEDEFTFSHITKGKMFYKTFVNAKRLSGVEDHVLLVISEELKNDMPEKVSGKIVRVSGNYVSSNIFEGEKNHLILYFYAKDVTFLSREKEGNNNLVYLKGHICRKPRFRYTPMELRITDVMLAVNRDSKRTDYIPLIFWGNSAEKIADLDVGSKIEIYGRIQSRKYLKDLENNNQEEREAYEVSCAAYNEF